MEMLVKNFISWIRFPSSFINKEEKEEMKQNQMKNESQCSCMFI